MSDHKVLGNMVFFTKEELENSPSRAEGISAEEEGALRKMAQQIIIDVCQSLHVHVQYAYVAVYLCFRYYAVKSWKRNDRWLIMPAALSLALKMRESPKPVVHIIAEFERRRWRDYERSRPGEPRRSHDKAYIDSLKEPFNLAERAVLFVVGFEFGIGDPYPHVAKQLRALGLTDEGDRNAKIEVQQMAWNFLRDSLSTTICLRYPPEKIAATAIFLSFQVYRRPLPLSAEPDVPAEEGEAVEASKEAATFYDVCNILPGEVIEIGNEIISNYIAAVRHTPAPQITSPPPGSGRRPVTIPHLKSAVEGDRWLLTHDADGAANGAPAAAAAPAVPPATAAAAAGGFGRGGGSWGGGDEAGAVPRSGVHHGNVRGEGRGAQEWAAAAAAVAASRREGRQLDAAGTGAQPGYGSSGEGVTGSGAAAGRRALDGSLPSSSGWGMGRGAPDAAVGTGGLVERGAAAGGASGGAAVKRSLEGSREDGGAAAGGWPHVKVSRTSW